jgi:NadR type nicotinamide-nucleotide adenylyltransferase
MEKGNHFKFGIKKIAIIGPESTGKTTLTKDLASHFQTLWVPEFAREYVENLNRKYNYDDVIHIIHKQIERDNYFSKQTNGFLFFDTELIILKVWLQIVYQDVPKWIETEIKKCNIQFYLLCNTELPWIPDKVRENGGEMRLKLFDIYKTELINYGFPFEIIKGIGQERLENSITYINSFFSK